jgi:single-strand DNA-binding protein
MSMSAANVTIIVGNLTADPELRFTPSGQPVASLRVAVNKRVQNQQTREWETRTDGFFDVSAWRDLAENVAETLRKGDRVLVTGRLTSRTYDDSEGKKRTAWEIEADEVCPSLRFVTAELRKTARRGAEPEAPAPADEATPF